MSKKTKTRKATRKRAAVKTPSRCVGRRLPGKPGKRRPVGKLQRKRKEAKRKPAPEPILDPALHKHFYVLACQPEYDAKVRKEIIKRKKQFFLNKDIGRTISKRMKMIVSVPKRGEVIAEGRELEYPLAKAKMDDALLERLKESNITPDEAPEFYQTRVFPARGLERGKVGNGYQWEIRTITGEYEDKERSVKKYPGYLIIHMLRNDRVIAALDNIKFSFGLLPIKLPIDSNPTKQQIWDRVEWTPTALSTLEAAEHLIQKEEAKKRKKKAESNGKPKRKLVWRKGDHALVSSGIFVGQKGIVSQPGPMDTEITTTLMGREITLRVSNHHLKRD